MFLHWFSDASPNVTGGAGMFASGCICPVSQRQHLPPPPPQPPPPQEGEGPLLPPPPGEQPTGQQQQPPEQGAANSEVDPEELGDAEQDGPTDAGATL